MKKIISIISTCIILGSCSCFKHIPREEVHIVVRDSVAVSIKDSINWIPKERIVDVVAQYDTLNLETSLAVSQAYVDTTTHTLKGKIENKQGVQQQYTEKIIYKEHRDTTYIEKPVPYEVEKPVKYIPKIYKWSLAFSIAVLLILGIGIYLKFSKVDILSLFKKK